MGEGGGATGWGWRRLWCIPQRSREGCRENDFGHLELDAIGSAFGRDRTRRALSGVGSGIETWSSTIVADLTR
jgi:hypothetical protein